MNLGATGFGARRKCAECTAEVMARKRATLHVDPDRCSYLVIPEGKTRGLRQCMKRPRIGSTMCGHHIKLTKHVP